MGRDGLDPDHARAAFVFSWSTIFIVLTSGHVENLPHETATLHTADRRASRRIRCVPSKQRSLLPPASSPPIPLPKLVLVDSQPTTKPTRHSLAADNRPAASLGFLVGDVAVICSHLWCCGRESNP